MSNEQERAAADAGRELNPPEPAAAGASTARPRGGGLALLVGLLALVVGGAAAGLAWQQRTGGAARLADLHGRLAALERAEAGRSDAREAGTKALEEALARATRAQEATEQALAELRERQAAFARELEAVNARVAAQASAAASVDRALALAEVEGLLRTAGERLALAADVRTALTALDTADRRLAAVSEPRLAPLRERIAEDRAALAAVPVPDVEGHALYFAALAARIDELDLRPLDELPAAGADTPREPATGWRGVVERIWRDLKGLVEVRSANPADQVLIDPAERFALEQAVRLELTAARLALLNRDSANLRAAATLLVQLLDRYFDPADPSVQDLREKLAEVAVIELEPALPDLGQSLAMVAALRATNGE